MYRMKIPMAVKLDQAITCLIVLFFIDTVSGLLGEVCGFGACFYGYHCCSQSSGYCCPDGFVCSGSICISLVVIIAPIVIGVIVIIVIVVVVIACKKKRAQGVVIAPSSNVGYNVQHQQTTAYQYGPPGQPGQQPMNYQYGQPGQGVYPPHPAQPQGPPAYPGQPQTSTDPAYPPPPMEYKQP